MVFISPHFLFLRPSRTHALEIRNLWQCKQTIHVKCIKNTEHYVIVVGASPDTLSAKSGSSINGLTTAGARKLNSCPQ